MKLNAVMKLLDDNHADDFDVLCHEIKRVESQGRYAMEAMAQYYDQDNDLIPDVDAVPKFVLEFLIYHRDAIKDQFEHVKLLENISIKHYGKNEKYVNKNSMDPEILNLCRGFARKSSDHVRSFEIEMSKKFVGNKSKDYMSLSLLLDMFGKTTPEAKILGTYKFVKRIAKELNTDVTISLGKKTQRFKGYSKNEGSPSTN